MNGFYGVNMLMGFDTSAGVSLILILFYFLPALLAVLGRRDLKIPVCILPGQRVAISRRISNKWRLIGYGIVDQ